MKLLKLSSYVKNVKLNFVKYVNNLQKKRKLANVNVKIVDKKINFVNVIYLI